MTKNVSVLLVRVMDELNALFTLQQLLNIALEQMDNPSEETMDRVDLLISLYLPQAELRFYETKYKLQEIQQLLREDIDSRQADS